MIVIDGICMGHRLCAMPKCRNLPLDFQSQKLCAQHHRERDGLCGVVSCSNLASSQPARSGACSLPEHQQHWQAFTSTHDHETYGAYRRVIRNQQGRLLQGHDDESDEWVVEARRNTALATSAPDDPEQLIPHHQREGEDALPAPASNRIQHTWQYRHIHCLETVTRPCGCILAWTKFATSESPTNIIRMIEEIFPNPDSRPSYIVIDKACRILVMLISRGLQGAWFQTSRFLVDVFHFKNHRNDPTCQKFCNPTPAIRVDPNLVIPIQDGNRPVQFQRAFNTEAAEQLNAWFGGYASQLSHMHPDNHDFLVQAMLTRHFNTKAY